MRTITRTQINSNLESVNFIPTEQTITDMVLFEKEGVKAVLDAAIFLNEYTHKDMVWQILKEANQPLYEDFLVKPFETKGGIKGFALYPIRSEYANPPYKEVHILLYPKYKLPNYSLLYGHAPISTWEGHILENVREEYFLRFLEYGTPHIEVAIGELQFEG